MTAAGSMPAAAMHERLMRSAPSTVVLQRMSSGPGSGEELAVNSRFCRVHPVSLRFTFRGIPMLVNLSEEL